MWSYCLHGSSHLLYTLEGFSFLFAFIGVNKKKKSLEFDICEQLQHAPRRKKY